MHSKTVVLWVPFFLFFQCVNSITEISDNDPIEFESVWQYLKAYSVYQDECVSGSGVECIKRLRDNPFFYQSPLAMMDSIYDTLHGDSYTGYFDASTRKSAHGIMRSGDDSIKVSFHQLTLSTAMIKIDEFKTEVTYRQFKEVLPKLKSNHKNCILDLRGNMGGDLEELDSILEMFLDSNSQYILARERKYDSLIGQFKTFDYHPLTTTRQASPYLAGKKFVVLMDSGTASAAEILAAALKDCAGAILAGQKSYGKAIGQIRLHRRGRLGIKITCLQFKGISFGVYQNSGIQPDSIININLKKKEYLIKAVGMVEPHVDSSSINFPSGLPKAMFSKAVAEGYRDVYQE